MGNARLASLKALEKCRRSDAWSDAVLGSIMDGEKLEGRDRGLASAICYGVLQNRMLLDAYIDRFSSVKAVKLEPKVLDIMRISAYQLIFMDRIPASAAVNEGVKLCRKLGYSRAAGLVNAVLRRIAENADCMPLPEDDMAARLSIAFSHPLWLVEYFIEMLGEEETEALLKSVNSPVPSALQVNTNKTCGEELLSKLVSSGIDANMHPYLPDCILVRETGAVSEMPFFNDGYFYVQDAAAKMSVLAAEPKAGEKILDCCSAPGGKSFAAAVLSGGQAEITSCDIHENKLKRIRDSATRLGLSNISTHAADARVFVPGWEAAFDTVIADVPCSGLGVIRKKPDIRYKDPKAFEALPDIQYDILKNVSGYVKPGGTLLYSTCTVRAEENGDVVSRFLSTTDCYVAEVFCLPGDIRSESGMLQLWPHRHGTDGFFISKLRRVK